MVKTLQHQASSHGFRVSDATWDGRDDYGDQLARGVYLYRVKVRGTDQNGQQTTAESEWEKLVILKQGVVFYMQMALETRVLKNKILCF